MDAAVEVLTPFANGTEDPYSHIETVKETYETLYPIDSLLSRYYADHRGELPDDTEQAIRSFRTGSTGYSTILLAEHATGTQMLEGFINNTLDSIEDIRPVLRELDPPENPP